MKPRFSLGPILYYWPEDVLKNFYREVAESSIDIVYLGETICSKRRSLNFDGWMSLAQELADAGKEVVLSTLALLEAESELKTLRRICANGRFLVEANDLGAVQLLSKAGVPFVAGHSVNIYNHNTLRVLAGQGLKRWVLPVELGRETLKAMQAERPEGVETEVFAYGRLPLAYAARCYTARHHNLPKDDCQLRCLDDPDGLLVKTQEDQSFLTLNGIQTQSAQVHSLLPDLPEVLEAGVDILRISPQSNRPLRIIEAFREALDAPASGVEIQQKIRPLMPSEPCNGYWHQKPGIALVL